MTRRTMKRTAVAVLATGGVLAGLGFLAETADAATTDPVDYEVGGLRVFGTTSRNPSCSITRNLRNESSVPVFVIGTALWDSQLTDADPGNNGGVFPQVGDSQYTGAEWLQPGEQVTAVWNGVDRTPPTLTGGAVQLSWSVILQPGVDVGVGHLEFVEPCQEGPPVDTVPPPVDTTAPSVPPSTVSTVPVSSTTPPPPVDEAAPPTTVVETQVLTSSVGPLEELPHTGMSRGDLIPVGLILVAIGLVFLSLRDIVRDGVKFPKDGHR